MLIRFQTIFSEQANQQLTKQTTGKKLVLMEQGDGGEVTVVQQQYGNN